jgi:hypothetical protein
MPRGVRTNSGSPKIVLKRASALLIAGCDSPMRSPATVTLPSVAMASKARSRFRSRSLIFMFSMYLLFFLNLTNLACA